MKPARPAGAPSGAFNVTGPGPAPTFACAAARLAGAAGVLLGWRPPDFWAATPAELACVIRALAGDAPHASPPDRATIQRLMKEHPDG